MDVVQPQQETETDIILSDTSMKTFLLNLAHDWHHDTSWTGLGKDRWKLIATTLNNIVNFITGLQMPLVGGGSPYYTDEVNSFLALISKLTDDYKTKFYMNGTENEDLAKILIQQIVDIHFDFNHMPFEKQDDQYMTVEVPIEHRRKVKAIRPNKGVVGGKKRPNNTDHIPNKRSKLELQYKKISMSEDHVKETVVNKIYEPENIDLFFSFIENVRLILIQIRLNTSEDPIYKLTNNLSNLEAMDEAEPLLDGDHNMDEDDSDIEVINIASASASASASADKPHYIAWHDEDDHDMMIGGGTYDQAEKLKRDINILCNALTAEIPTLGTGDRIQRNILNTAYISRKNIFLANIEAAFIRHDFLFTKKSYISNIWRANHVKAHEEIPLVINRVKEAVLDSTKSVFREQQGADKKQALQQKEAEAAAAKAIADANAIASGQLGDPHKREADLLNASICRRMLHITGLIDEYSGDCSNSPNISSTDIEEQILLGQIGTLCIIGDFTYKKAEPHKITTITDIQKKFRLLSGYDDNLISLVENILTKPQSLYTSSNLDLHTNVPPNPNARLVINNACTELQNCAPVLAEDKVCCALDSIKDPQQSCSKNTAEACFFGGNRRYVVRNRGNSMFYETILSIGGMTANDSYEIIKGRTCTLNASYGSAVQVFNTRVDFTINNVAESLSATQVMRRVIDFCLLYYNLRTNNGTNNTFFAGGFWETLYFDTVTATDATLGSPVGTRIIDIIITLAHQKGQGDIDQELFALSKYFGITNNEFIRFTNTGIPLNIIMPFVNSGGQMNKDIDIYEFTPDRPSAFRLFLLGILGSNINQGFKGGFVTRTRQLYLNTPSTTSTIRTIGGKKQNKTKQNKTRQNKTRQNKTKSNKKTKTKRTKKRVFTK